MRPVRAAAVLYVLAGGFGGYGPSSGLLRFGNCCWLLGSLISGTRPCLSLYSACACASTVVGAGAHDTCSTSGSVELNAKTEAEVCGASAVV